ncbi:MAG: galU, partial [Alphaproteobacteria bacterium]|nr:galU [Alphaproteobacteria bacterium]
MSRTVRKAVFPVAGLGTRTLPATKAIPKEMLTIVDKPLIQYAVEECLAAGIEQFVFVTGRNKGSIEDHFDHAYELEATLVERKKTVELQQTMASLIPPGNAIFTRQEQPLGLGHAVWCARHWIGDEPFAVLLPDELTLSSPSCTAELVATHERTRGNVISVVDVPKAQTNRYGIVATGKDDGKLVE